MAPGPTSGRRVPRQTDRQESDMPLASLTPYQLAALFHELATRRCRSWTEDDQRKREMDEVSREMDRRDVRLEDWALTAHDEVTAEL